MMEDWNDGSGKIIGRMIDPLFRYSNIPSFQKGGSWLL